MFKKYEAIPNGSNQDERMSLDTKIDSTKMNQVQSKSVWSK